MKQSEKLFKTASVTFEKYRKNKTLVSPEDLAGKYRVPFQRLKHQLADELSDYLMAYCLEGLELAQDNKGYFDAFIASVNRIIQESIIGRRVGQAVFNSLDMAQVYQIAEELRIKIYNEAWVPLFQKHMCLEVTEGCFSDNDPLIPRIYNSLVDMFWNEKTGEWVKDDAPRKPAMFIYISENREEINHGKE